MNTPRIKADLTGIPETMLWPLYCRAEESRRPDSFLRDPVIDDLYASIDYPFHERFGAPRTVLALRALTFDRQIETFLARHPDGTVVALGDGLETQFHRVDNGRVHWVSVDLPEATELRRRLLPGSDRARIVTCSALDRSWMDEIDDSRGLLITALGLFMYLDGTAVLDLITTAARRFRGAELLFDAVPPWLVRETGGGTRLSALMMRGRADDDADTNTAYRLPPMVWGTSTTRVRKALADEPAVAAVHDVPMVPGRGFVFRRLNPVFGSTAPVRRIRPNNVLVEFA
ncbi:class I SAM-dependent methyltransferase [Gordonia soli]|uniref:Putative methyltransferase n=1 Tax=Gordonia soli NBRC 108243 TaxID=1223545 RepID=M0QHW6_9ACTN|nr:class I SAM-dependent methyltransferase [Gordonia soli]GAC67866.1 putative methyltransferase [Gordonia soli NBRC 108243]